MDEREKGEEHILALLLIILVSRCARSPEAFLRTIVKNITYQAHHVKHISVNVA